jgi:uncharacterized protein YjbI with pentapeptide repeats
VVFVGNAGEADAWTEAQVEAVIKVVSRDGVVTAHGACLNEEQLQRLLEAAPRKEGAPGLPELRRADFYGARFTDHVTFRQVSFSGEALFGGSIFEKGADFHSAIFAGDADFSGASLGSTGFVQATFYDVDFDLAIASGDLSFEDANFQGTADLGTLLIGGELNLKGARFIERARMEAGARTVRLDDTQFRGGADVWLQWADVSLRGTDFAERSLLAGLPAAAASAPRPRISRGARAVQRPTASARKPRLSIDLRRWLPQEELEGSWGWLHDVSDGSFPRVTSLVRASVAQLTVAEVDVQACRFLGARGLDSLRLERTRFAHPPPGFRLSLKPMWWTRRQTIAEEHEWRRRHGHGPGWDDESVRLPDSSRIGFRDPQDIAATYRELRKGMEDSKNEPGASDFYYGEMEMRRFDHNKPRAERIILWFYWLVSGYGLRASRAFLSLAVTVFVFGLLLHAWGFPSHRSLLDAMTFAAESTTSLFRPPERSLTLAGEWLQIGLRLLGPLFFGLALLSLRGRVKR